jgi:hypothetical protein
LLVTLPFFTPAASFIRLQCLAFLSTSKNPLCCCPAYPPPPPPPQPNNQSLETLFLQRYWGRRHANFSEYFNPSTRGGAALLDAILHPRKSKPIAYTVLSLSFHSVDRPPILYHSYLATTPATLFHHTQKNAFEKNIGNCHVVDFILMGMILLHNVLLLSNSFFFWIPRFLLLVVLVSCNAVFSDRRPQ